VVDNNHPQRLRLANVHMQTKWLFAWLRMLVIPWTELHVPSTCAAWPTAPILLCV
jgi:hypothetical protein